MNIKVPLVVGKLTRKSLLTLLFGLVTKAQVTKLTLITKNKKLKDGMCKTARSVEQYMGARRYHISHQVFNSISSWTGKEKFHISKQPNIVLFIL